MQKKDELFDKGSCLNKASDGEILFVLRSNDPIAPQTIRHWAAMSSGRHEPEKIAEALRCADEMEQQYNATPKAATTAYPPAQMKDPRR